MRRGHGVFTTLLMLVPMTAVPMMAVFGIPEFVSVSASPFNINSDSKGSEFQESRAGQSDALLVTHPGVPSHGDLDLFRPYGHSEGQTDSPEAAGTSAAPQSDSSRQLAWHDPLRTTAPKQNRHGIPAAAAPDFSHKADQKRHTEVSQRIRSNSAGAAVAAELSTSGTLDSNALSEIPPVSRDRESHARYSRAGEGKKSSESARQMQAPSISWQVAVDRLNSLGIQTFRLSPDATANGYRFVCLVTSVDDPRISRRFEAESFDPLIAVQNVVEQVAAWNVHR